MAAVCYAVENCDSNQISERFVKKLLREIGRNTEQINDDKRALAIIKSFVKAKSTQVEIDDKL